MVGTLTFQPWAAAYFRSVRFRELTFFCPQKMIATKKSLPGSAFMYFHILSSWKKRVLLSQFQSRKMASSFIRLELYMEKKVPKTWRFVMDNYDTNFLWGWLMVDIHMIYILFHLYFKHMCQHEQIGRPNVQRISCTTHCKPSLYYVEPVSQGLKM